MSELDKSEKPNKLTKAADADFDETHQTALNAYLHIMGSNPNNVNKDDVIKWSCSQCWEDIVKWNNLHLKRDKVDKADEVNNTDKVDKADNTKRYGIMNYKYIIGGFSIIALAGISFYLNRRL